MADEYARPFQVEVHEVGGTRRTVTILEQRQDESLHDALILVGSDGRFYERRLHGLGVVELSPERPA